ncbi:hypothetical protein ACNQF7_06790 [Flavobacterium sp. RSP29]
MKKTAQMIVVFKHFALSNLINFQVLKQQQTALFQVFMKIKKTLKGVFVE